MTSDIGFKYRAFLSYAHKDMRWAAWLHKRLEGFRFEGDLVGRKTALGEVPRSLQPIFRDRDDFSGGHSLTDATLAALDASAALIVVCSTAAAASQYVNEEARLFRWRHPDRPVVPVIVDGAYPDNFPPALRREIAPDGTLSDRLVTILGPDLRDAGDGQTLGLAKVIAGLTGLDVNDIFRRAERAARRARRIRAAIAASLILSVGAGGFFYWRSSQQSVVIQANQRVIADKEAREREIRVIVEREMAKRPGVATSPGQQQDLAAAIRSLFEQADEGDATAAKIAELLRANKVDEAIDLKVAAAEARERKVDADRKQAAKEFREAAALAENANPGRARELYIRAARLDPDDVRGQFQAGWFQQDAGDLTAAESAYRRVLATAKPDADETWIYWARLGLGDIQVARGDLAVAKASYRQAGEAVERLAKADPGNSGWQRDLSVSYDRVGDVQVAQGNLAEALQSFRASLAIAERLAKADPGNSGWQRDLGISHERIGDVQVDQWNLAQALQSYQAQYEIAERLAKADPGNSGWQGDLAASHGKLGQLYVALGQKSEALQHFKSGRAIVAPFAEKSGHQLWIGYLKSFDSDIAALDGK